MWKYMALMFVVFVLSMYYVYVSDPCRSQMFEEFEAKYPGYEIIDTDADEGSPESVRCRIFYRKPGGVVTHEQLWLYRNAGDGWHFARLLQSTDEETQ
jgi:hypothetical protein